MRLAYKRFSVVAGFVLLLTVLLLNAVVTRSQLAVQDNNQDWVAHTQQVLLELVTVQSLLGDAESGQRGFLYTGEPRYLGPYTAAVALVDAHINKLVELTADNQEQQPRIASLRQLAAEKLGELAQTITLAQSGHPEQARAMVLSDVGKVTMDKIRVVTGEIQQGEERLLAVRLKDVSASTKTLVRTIYLATGLAVIGLVLLAYYILREMSQRERHAREIREREEWFRVTLGSIGDAVIATDERGAVTFLNRIAEELLGVQLHAVQGQTVEKVFPIFNEVTRLRVENPVAKVLEQGRIIGLANHTVLERTDGKIIPIEDSAAPIYDDQHKLRGVVMVFRDVTLGRQTQEVMRKAEKLAAASRLAASMAHEINNPLEAVCNLVYLVKNSAGLSEEMRSYLTMAERELERVSHVTRQTLGFYRDPAGPIAVDIRNVVESVLKLYENKLRDKDISVQLVLDHCPPVRGLQGDLKQLIANLVSNAADAVNHGGKIRISALRTVSADGGAVEIKVADNGPGVALENRSHLFEPFFTTKQDIGTGLGLWVSRQIAERHQGTIEVANGDQNDLGGAVFTVSLRGVAESDAMGGAA